MPEGVCYDFKTGKKFPGDKKYVSFFKEEDYPVFARAGSVIPLSNRSDVNNVGLPLDMEIHIFLEFLILILFMKMMDLLHYIKRVIT